MWRMTWKEEDSLIMQWMSVVLDNKVVDWGKFNENCDVMRFLMEGNGRDDWRRTKLLNFKRKERKLDERESTMCWMREREK